MAAESSEFEIKLTDGVAGPAENAADSLEHLRQRILKGQDAIKSMVADMRRLSGASDEVKAAKNTLKSKVMEQRKAITDANLAIMKEGLSFDTLTQKQESAAKKAAEEAARLKETASVRENEAKKAAEEAQKLADKQKEAAEQSANVMKMAAVATAVAVVKLTQTLIEGAIAFGKWALEAGNAARTQALWRQSIMGSSEAANAMQWNIDELAKKLPTPRAKLQELGQSLWKSGIDGQMWADSMGALGQISEAMGEDVAGSFRNIIEANKLIGRFQLPDPREMRGWGVNFEDIAQSLAKNLKVGIGDARAALRSGRVKIQDGVKALKDAAEKKFGDINLRKSLDLNVISGRFKESMIALVSGINWEPLLSGLSSMQKLFDQDSVLGWGLRKVFSAIGDSIVSGIVKYGPAAEDALYRVATAALKVVIAGFEMKNILMGAIPADSKATQFTLEVQGLGVALRIANFQAKGFVESIKWLYYGFEEVSKKIPSVDSAIAALVSSIKKYFASAQWKELGGNIIDGLIQGLKDKFPEAEKVMKELSKLVKEIFGKGIESHSPSRVFARFGADTVAGYAQGVEGDAPKAAQAVDRLASRSVKAAADANNSRAAGTSSKGGNTVTVNVSISSASPNLAQDPSFMANLTKAIETALISQGLAA